MPSLIRFLCGAAEDFSCGSAPSATVAPRQAAAEKKDLRFNINAFSSELQVECRYHNQRREGKLEPRIASDALWLTSREAFWSAAVLLVLLPLLSRPISVHFNHLEDEAFHVRPRRTLRNCLRDSNASVTAGGRARLSSARRRTPTSRSPAR